MYAFLDVWDKPTAMRIERPNFAPSQKSIFGSASYLSPRSSDGSRCPCLHHHFPFYPPKHPHHHCRRQNPNWFGRRNKSDSWFAFEWGPGARIYIIGLDYVGSDINRASQRCHRDEGYFVLTDFLRHLDCTDIKSGYKWKCSCRREKNKAKGRLEV